MLAPRKRFINIHSKYFGISDSFDRITPITCNTINQLNVVTVIVIYILGKARADANEIVIEFFRNLFWRRNAMIVNLDFLNTFRSLFIITSENIINGFPSLPVTFSICEA